MSLLVRAVILALGGNPAESLLVRAVILAALPAADVPARREPGPPSFSSLLGNPEKRRKPPRKHPTMASVTRLLRSAMLRCLVAWFTRWSLADGQVWLRIVCWSLADGLVWLRIVCWSLADGLVNGVFIRWSLVRWVVCWCISCSFVILVGRRESRVAATHPAIILASRRGGGGGGRVRRWWVGSFVAP